MTRARDIADQAYISDDKIQTNLALLAFKTAVNGSLAKYDLQDQVIDEYAHASDTSGVDDGPSDNHVLASGAYSGTTVVSPTITHGANATGIDGLYTWYKWTDVASETYQTNTAQDYDYIVVAGGGGGGRGGARGGGGGGAGGFRTAASLAVAADTSISVIVGGGGTASSSGSSSGGNGGDSTFSSITSTGGGGGGSESSTGGVAGGSGGGGAGHSVASTAVAGAGTSSQGYAGGVGKTSANWEGGGGGGSSEVGEAGASDAGGDGGDGENNVMGMNDADSDTLLTAASAGHDVGGLRYFAGGGGGAIGLGSGTNGSGGSGGGGAANSGSGGPAAISGTANTGGGGGGHGYNGTVGAGGSGIVIIRRLTSVTTIGNLTLQSTDTAAEAVPTKADIVMLVEDAGSGVGVLNTDIKAYISRDSGVHATDSWTQATLTDEGDWGTDKRILVAHDVSLTAKNSGQAMCYKITTHNADSAKNTKIHATSIGWR